MIVAYRYGGRSAIVNGMTRSQLAFATNALREATFLEARVRFPLQLREGLATLYQLVVGDFKYLVRVDGEFEDPALIEDLVITTVDGRPVYVRDVADVEFGFAERETFARLDDNAVVTLDIVKRTGENIIETSDAVRAVIDRMRPAFPGQPAGCLAGLLLDFGDLGTLDRHAGHQPLVAEHEGHDRVLEGLGVDVITRTPLGHRHGTVHAGLPALALAELLQRLVIHEDHDNGVLLGADL